MPDQIDLKPFKSFVITGTDVAGHRNAPRHSTNFAYLQAFNYWTKTMWGILPSGRRKLLYRVSN